MKNGIPDFLFPFTIELRIKALDFQRGRIFNISSPQEFFSGHGAVHDADYYMVLVRRLYREIENYQYDSRVANLKGRYKDLYKKMKIRDDFEHGVDYEKVIPISPGMTFVSSVILDKVNPRIVSGAQEWFLNEDHENFKKMLMEFAGLHPFTVKPIKKNGKIHNLLRKIQSRVELWFKLIK
jgi:hypothetical protein